MQYFHRTHLSPDDAVASATEFFGRRLGPAQEEPRRRQFASPLGRLTVTVRAEGGHYTLVTVETNQPGESELDKLGRRFLTLLHAAADPTHRPIGAY
jgi:hypothetical protein